MSAERNDEFYVAGEKPGQAYAAMVADTDASSIKRFYRQHAGATIMKVGRDEMEKMLRAFIQERDLRKAKGAEQ